MGKDNLVRTFLGIITFSVLVFSLERLSELLIPIIVAAIFSIMFKPLITILTKKKIPTGISLLLVIAILAVSFYLLGAMLYSSSKPLITGLPEYKDKLSQIIESVINVLTNTVQTLGIQFENIDPKTLLGATTYTASALSESLATFLHFIGFAALVLLYMLFMISGTGNLGAKIKMAYPQEKATIITDSLRNMGHQIRRYIVLKIIMNAITGLLTGLILWLLGVDFPVFWGLLGFLVCFIPNIGAVIAIGAPFVLSLLQFDNFTIPILVIALLGLVYMVMGSLVEPKFMASSLNLSVLLILVALIFWGLVWGPWGMLLAIPLTTIIKIIFANVESLKPISILMGSKTEY
jgi:predicted PurR-regulated permease PerM